MAVVPLEERSQGQKERLRFIDFRLCFLATLNRNDLIKRFGIKEAAATRDIAAYRELKPQNAEYFSNAKSYLKSDNFEPLFEYSAHSVLETFATGLGDDSVVEHKAILPCEMPSHLTRPNLDIVTRIANAIALSKVIKIRYYSVKSGSSVRELVPFTFVNNGLRWHVRGYDRLKNRFGDFVLTRIESAELLRKDPEEHETRAADNEWNRIVELELVPHPARENHTGIEMDYAMKDGVIKISIRAAIAGYLLRLWNVDCSREHKSEDSASQLWLRNSLALYGVDNALLAPGYEKPTN